jgi:integrase
MYRALVLLGGYAGLRLGELAGLRAERIDFLRRRVVVSESIVESGGQLHRRTTKTGRARVVTLPALVVEELAEHPPGVDGLVLPLLEAADPGRRSSEGDRPPARALLYYDHVGSLRAPLPGTR